MSIKYSIDSRKILELIISQVSVNQKYYRVLLIIAAVSLCVLATCEIYNIIIVYDAKIF